MFVVGVTGGIGSGKTAVTNHFAKLGIDIVDTDIASRIVVEPGKPALQAIVDHFGIEILLPNGQLNRALLRQQIFADNQEKTWLESLLHPLIAEETTHLLRRANSPYVILVSPLLIEGGQYRICDRVLVIDVPEELQIQRTVARDNNQREQVERIISSQAPRQQRLEKATDVIVNDGSLQELQQQVEHLHKLYLQLAAEKAEE